MITILFASLGSIFDSLHLHGPLANRRQLIGFRLVPAGAGAMALAMSAALRTFKMRLPALALLLLACPARGQAEPTQQQIEAEYSPALDACLRSGDAARGVSVAMGACMREELALQDSRLNAAYAAIMKSLDRSGRAALRAEERSWIKQRDAACNDVAVGGTIDLVDIPNCLLDETIRRRILLEARGR
ncbi:lysozyme inhibitor LprI family protein [Sphingosinicella sp. BN140058]|uniref:lysozyme inhibitor LprI family protein n=1 Tax=Sphingosinicella sp. BN140058 TaxID=1892855 RepID=UPI0013EA846C|nr:lysozyme inhibitor LprI family protein [Sphingosinicella sp. BN140058]